MKLLSERDLLYIELIKKLKKRSYSYDELLLRLDISRNNLTKVIQDLNQIVGTEIISIQKAVISLNLNRNISYDYCISKILKNSFEYTLLEYIFFNENTSYQSLSLALYVSESTIRKVIGQLNVKLRTIDCEILTRPIRMDGNERNIRTLYFRLFKEKYGVSNTPFEGDEKQFINQFYEIAFSFSYRNQSLQERLNFQLMSLVALTRKKNQHAFTTCYNNNLCSSSIESKVLEYSTSEIKKIPESLSTDFLEQVFSVFLKDEFVAYANYKELATSDNRDFQSLLKIIDEIAHLFNVVINEEEKLKLCRDMYDGIFGYLSVEKEVADLTIVNDEYYNFLQETDLLLRDIIPIIKEIFLQYIREDKRYYFPLAYFLIRTRFNNIIIEGIGDKLKVNVYVYIDFDMHYAKYVQKKIEFEIGNLVDVYLLRDIAEMDEKYQKGDLIVTNLIIDGYDNLNMFRISHYFNFEVVDPIILWLREERRRIVNEFVMKKI